MLHCLQCIYILFSTWERSVNVFISARPQVNINFSGQFEHDHFSHLLAFADHEIVGFFGGLFVFETKKPNLKTPSNQTL